MRSLPTILATLFVFAPCAAVAETYVAVSLSMTMPSTETVRGVPRATGTSESVDLTTDSGLGGAIAWGKVHESGRRTELELGYRPARTDAFETPDRSPLVWERDNPNNWEAQAPAEGDISTTTLMVNHLGEFGEGAVRPYLGAGLGVALHSADVRTYPGVLQRGFVDTLSGETVVFAWQAMFGVTYGPARLGYRWIQTADAEIDGLTLTYGKHVVEIGVWF